MSEPTVTLGTGYNTSVTATTQRQGAGRYIECHLHLDPPPFGDSLYCICRVYGDSHGSIGEAEEFHLDVDIGARYATAETVFKLSQQMSHSLQSAGRNNGSGHHIHVLYHLGLMKIPYSAFCIWYSTRVSVPENFRGSVREDVKLILQHSNPSRNIYSVGHNSALQQG